jgi:molybdate transport system ATP-binding protein
VADGAVIGVVAERAGLAADVRLRRGGFLLDLSLAVEPGEVVALLGPNGAGKSTTLRVLAGLLPCDDGVVRLGRAVLEDTDARVRMPPERRQVGVVFQDYLLFPHLTARENVAFGLRSRGVERAEARRRADEWLGRVGLSDLAGRRPRELSGGQAQRVALARALVADPLMMLLDEPLAALDAGTRVAVRADLRRHLAAFAGPSVVVTHDALDAFVLADRLVVLESGRVVQTGTPEEVARRPVTDYVARLVGLNLYRGHAADGTVTLEGGMTLSGAHHEYGPVLVAFPPSAVVVHRRRPEGSARNCWSGVVSAVEQHGDTVRVRLTGPLDTFADLTPLSVAELGLEPGAEVWAAVKATETSVYPA